MGFVSELPRVMTVPGVVARILCGFDSGGWDALSRHFS